MKNNEYSADSIQVLEGLEAIRKRPGMYIGTVDFKGLHHLVWEVLDNSIDEAMAGYAKNISVEIIDDYSIIISDDGRGIPVGIHSKTGLSTVETVLTTIHAGGKFDSKSYKVSGGLHGVGASVVNALSKEFEVWVNKDSKVYYQRFTNGGNPDGKLKIIGETDERGTKIKFTPDFTILDKNPFDYSLIASRLKQTAYLNRGLTLSIIDRRVNDRHETFCFDGGVVQYVKDLNRGRDKIHETIIYAQGDVEGKDGIIAVEVAMQYNSTYQNNILSYVNNISTKEGGTHEQGFMDATARLFNKYAKENKYIKTESEKITREDIKEGLITVISIKHPEPIFEGQTKGKLGNKDVRQAVNKVLSVKLRRFLDENPDQAKAIITKLLSAQRARLAAQKAREVERKNAISDIGSLPGKLADCSSKDPVKSELYIVEGDSAGGSAKMGRDRAIQAILPLRGKVINAEKGRKDKVFANNEIGALITAIGTGVEEDFNLEKLRYHKIIIMTDADVDGAHIRTLLLTFLYRYFKNLIENGYIYIAQPPLYKISKSNQHFYAYTDSDKDEILAKFEKGTKVTIQRYKGLGEMDPQQLWETTMDPSQRKMKKVAIEDAAMANWTFSTLMGEDVPARRDFINKNAKYAEIDV